MPARRLLFFLILAMQHLIQLYIYVQRKSVVSSLKIGIYKVLCLLNLTSLYDSLRHKESLDEFIQRLQIVQLGTRKHSKYAASIDAIAR